MIHYLGETSSARGFTWINSGMCCSAWSRLPGPSCSRGLFAWSLQRPVGVREKELKQTGTEGKWRFPKIEVPIGTPNHPSHGWPCLVLKPPNVDEMLMSFCASQAFWQQHPKASGLLIPTAPQRMLSCVKWLPGLRGGLSRSPLTSLPSRIWINVHFRAVHSRPRLRQQPAATILLLPKRRIQFVHCDHHVGDAQCTDLRGSLTSRVSDAVISKLSGLISKNPFDVWPKCQSRP